MLLVGGLWLGTRPARSELRCPSGQVEDAGRARRIERLLARTPRGGLLLAPRRRVCFAELAASALGEDGGVILDREASDPENAARLGHLLLHASEEARLPELSDPRRSCAWLVDAAIAAEARAHGFELELRRELGVTRARRRYSFEAGYWAAPAPRRLALIRDRLRAEPDGLARAYASRCATLRGSR